MSESLFDVLSRAYAEAWKEAGFYNYQGAYAILRRGYEESFPNGFLSDQAAPCGAGGRGDLVQPATAVSGVREGRHGAPERLASAASPAIRLAEIRQENSNGDVSYRDIEWLCGVGEAAVRLVAAGRGSRELMDALR